MATAMKKTTVKTASTSTTKTKDTVKTEPIVNEVIEEVTEIETKKKVYNASDEIPCASLFPGQYFVEGARSGDLYTFAEIDDVQYIRYDDLDYMVKRHMAPVYKPRFVILEEEFLNLHPDIEELYGSLYTSSDLKDILKLSPAQIKSKLSSLPSGAKDAFKVLVMNEIESGKFDSINRIKAIDEFFGTQMAILVGN